MGEAEFCENYAVLWMAHVIYLSYLTLSKAAA